MSLVIGGEALGINWSLHCQIRNQSASFSLKLIKVDVRSLSCVSLLRAQVRACAFRCSTFHFSLPQLSIDRTGTIVDRCTCLLTPCRLLLNRHVPLATPRIGALIGATACHVHQLGQCLSLHPLPPRDPRQLRHRKEDRCAESAH